MSYSSHATLNSECMSMNDCRSRLVRLRAAGVLLALLLSCLSAPVALAFDAPDVCAMACCVKEGHCCCSPQRTKVKGQNAGEPNQINSAKVSSPCPEGCALPSIASHSSFRDSDRPATNQAAPVAATFARSLSPVVASSTDRSRRFSPRAPPPFPSHQAA